MSHADGKTTTQAQVTAWETADPLLSAMYFEFKELSKKKPDGVVGKAKIAIVNRLLTKCREALAGEATLPFLDVLSEDDVPQSSDVVLMLSQYVSAMKGFKDAYHGWDGSDHTWAITESAKRRR